MHQFLKMISSATLALLITLLPHSFANTLHSCVPSRQVAPTYPIAKLPQLEKRLFAECYEKPANIEALEALHSYFCATGQRHRMREVLKEPAERFSGGGCGTFRSQMEQLYLRTSQELRKRGNDQLADTLLCVSSYSCTAPRDTKSTPSRACFTPWTARNQLRREISTGATADYKRELAATNDDVILLLGRQARKDLRELRNFKNVKAVVVSAYGNEPKLSDEELAQLAEIPNLEEIWFDASQISLRGLESLRGAKNLAHISISGKEIGPAEISILAKVSTLKSLSLCGALTGSLKPLATLHGLEDLKIIGPSPFPELLLSISSLTSLRSIYFFETVFSKATGEALSKLPQLSKLNLDRVIYEPEAIQALSKIRGLREIELRPLFPLLPRDIEPLAQLPQLESLSIDYYQNTDEWIRVFTKLAGIRILDLQHIKVTQCGLSLLGQAKALEELSLPALASDETLRTLPMLPRLRELSITGPNVTDSGLQSLKDCRALETVEIHNSPITDRGLGSTKVQGAVFSSGFAVLERLRDYRQPPKRRRLDQHCELGQAKNSRNRW